MTPGGASGYPTTLESLSHVADSLHTRRGRCETGEKETLRISTDYAGFFSYVVSASKALHRLPPRPVLLDSVPHRPDIKGRAVFGDSGPADATRLFTQQAYAFIACPPDCVGPGAMSLTR